MAEMPHTPFRRYDTIDPTLIVEGKRIRKTVERFGDTTPSSSSRRTPARHFNGVGVPLGDIEKINQEIDESSYSELRSLHKILFGTVGRAATAKTEIKQFNGFTFNEDSVSYARKLTELAKISPQEVQLMKKVLGLNVTEVKGILDFLMAPKRPGTPAKRRSNEGARVEEAPKRARISDTMAGLLLSESSTDEEMEEEEPEKEKKPAVKPKKRVSFEEDHRLVQEMPGLSADQIEDDSVSENVRQTIAELIDSVDDVSSITIGWLLEEVIKLHPEHIADREAVKEYAIKELREANN